MGSDGVSVHHPSVVRNGDVAVLSDELAVVLEEARTAEASAMIDLDTARGELRARLQPLMAQRREILDAQLEQARSEAEQTVQAAGRAGSMMVAQAMARADEVRRVRQAAAARQAEAAEREIAEAEAAEREIAEAEVDVIEAPRLVVVPSVEPSEDDAMWARTTATGLEAALAETQIPAVDGVSTTNVIIDAEAFARVFATTIATLMQDRQPLVVQTVAAPVAAPAPLPVPARQSFWSNARHADVLLMGLATIIVIIVLAAWLA